MTLLEYLDQYDELVPFMDEESRKRLAQCIGTGETPEFDPYKLAEWVQLAQIKKKYWKDVKSVCKTKEASK